MSINVRQRIKHLLSKRAGAARSHGLSVLSQTRARAGTSAETGRGMARLRGGHGVPPG